MSRPVKCQFCQEKFVRTSDNYEHNSKGYYHKECFTKMNAERKKRDGLVAYIYHLFGKNVNLPLVNKQIKEYVDKYHYTESGIHGTLYYCYEIKKMPIAKAKGIGVVGMYYNEARKYYNLVNAVKEQELVEYKEKVVTITAPEVKSKRYKQVDLEELIDGE